MTKTSIVIGKRIESEAYKKYVEDYWSLYHLYGWKEERIVAELGPEPDRWIEETAVAADFDDRLEEERKYLADRSADSGRGVGHN